MSAVASHVGPALRWIPPLALLGLAWFFGRTLRAGATPLIERISRHAIVAPSLRLCRYTRGLTAVWCAYFVAAAAASVAAGPIDGAGYGRLGAAVWLGSIALFVGEWLLRKPLFPEYAFPSLVEQMHHTWLEWRLRTPDAPASDTAAPRG